MAVTALLLAALPGAARAKHDVSTLDWMGGCWADTSADAGSGETWTSPVGGALLGISRTIRDNRLVAWEFMRIEERDGGRVVFVGLPSGQAETGFEVNTMSSGRVEFVNPEHDFPQRITYWREHPDLLRARVEGSAGGKREGFDVEMRRVDCPGD